MIECSDIYCVLGIPYLLVETFTAIVLTLNILLVQGSSTMIDLSLIIGNQIDTVLSGFLISITL
jgi:hypothetical protein